MISFSLSLSLSVYIYIYRCVFELPINSGAASMLLILNKVSYQTLHCLKTLIVMGWAPRNAQTLNFVLLGLQHSNQAAICEGAWLIEQR